MASAAPGKDDGLRIQPSSESSPQNYWAGLTNPSAASTTSQKRITAKSGGRLGAEVLALGR